MGLQFGLLLYPIFYDPSYVMCLGVLLLVLAHPLRICHVFALVFFFFFLASLNLGLFHLVFNFYLCFGFSFFFALGLGILCHTKFLLLALGL